MVRISITGQSTIHAGERCHDANPSKLRSCRFAGPDSRAGLTQRKSRRVGSVSGSDFLFGPVRSGLHPARRRARRISTRGGCAGRRVGSRRRSAAACSHSSADNLLPSCRTSRRDAASGRSANGGGEADDIRAARPRDVLCSRGRGAHASDLAVVALVARRKPSAAQ